MVLGNRSSLVGVQPLPVITENPDASPRQLLPSASAPFNQYRRSLPLRYPSLLSNQEPKRSSTAERSWNAPHLLTGYLPTQTPAPIYIPSRHSNGSPSPTGPPRHYRQHSKSSGSAEKELVPVVIPLPDEEKDWFVRRGGWWRLGLYFFLFVALAVGLGIGLSIGLQGSHGAASDGDEGVAKRHFLNSSVLLHHYMNKARSIPRQFIS